MAMFESEFVCQPSERFPSCHCSTIVELPDGELLCAWYAGSAEARRDVCILTARKLAGATEWSEPVVAVDDDPTKPMGNCVLWIDARSRVWLFYNVMHGKLDGPWGPGVRWDTCDCRYRISEDGGRTWGDPVMLREEWNCVFRTKPLVHSGGDIIIGVEHSRENSHFFISQDQGAGWIFTDQIPGVPNQHPALIERRDGSILALLRPTRDHLIARSMSSDRGRTWAAAENTNLANPHAAIDMVKLTDGRVALAFNKSPRGRSPLTLALSEDEGETWPIMRDIETEQGEFSYPAIIQDRNGLLHLTYTWRRTHIRHACFDAGWIEGR
jgi:predicted neuraminidase